MTHGRDVPPTTEELLDAATRYAKAGLKVYPVYIPGLKPDGKKNVRIPIRSWKEQATDDLEQVRSWWGEEYPGAGIGVDVGRSGLAVVDADVKDGVDGIAAARERGWNSEAASYTPSGGVHGWYRDPDGTVGSGSNVAGTLDQPCGIDARGVGGTIFMPPTYVPGYGRYEWADGEPAWPDLPTAPPSLAAAAPPGGKKKSPAPTTTAPASAAAPQSGLGGAGLFGGSPAAPIVHTDRRLTQAQAQAALRPAWERVRDTHAPNGLWQAVADFARHAAHYQCYWDQAWVKSAVLLAYQEGGHGYSALDDGDLRAIESAYQLQAEARALADLDEGWECIPTLDMADPPPVDDDAVAALLAEMLTPSELRDRPFKRYLIKGWVHLDSEVWVIGAPGSFKSFVVLDQAAHVAAGRPWQGLAVAQGPVVIIAAEGAGGLSARVKAWEKEHGQPMSENVHVLPRPVQTADASAWAVLVKACERLKPVMVVADTQARISVGLEENSAKEMGIYVSAIGAVKRATGAAVFSVHHTGRNGGDARGSNAIDGAQDTELKVVAAEGLRAELRVEKQKDLSVLPPLKLALASHMVGVDEDGDPVTSLAVRGKDAWLDGEAEVAEIEDWVRNWPAVQQQIITVLVDQGGDVGLTRTDCRQLVADRWYDGVRGRKIGLRDSTFATAWTKVLEAHTVSGDPIVTNVRGERYAVDPDARAIWERGQQAATGQQ